MTEKNKPCLSLLICTAKRPIFLKDLLDSIDDAHAVDRSLNIEIVIVDNDVHGSALPIINLFQKHSPLTLSYYKEDEPNISVARNTAIKHASYDLCLFLDDDQLIERDFFQELIKTIEGADVNFSALRFPISWQYENRTSNAVKIAFEGESSSQHTQRFSELKRTEMGTGGLLLRLDRLRHLLPLFNNELGKSGGEDIDFFLRATKNGHLFFSTTLPNVIERVPSSRSTAKYMLKVTFRKGFVDAKLQLNGHNFSKRFFYFLKTILIIAAALIAGIIKTIKNPSTWLINLCLLWRQVGKLKAFIAQNHSHYRNRSPKTAIMHLTGGGQDGGAEKVIEQISSHTNEQQFRLSFFFYDTVGERGFSRKIQSNNQKVQFYKKINSIDWRLWKAIVGFVKNEDVAIIHTHDLGAMLHARIAKIFVPRLKLIHTEHTLHYWIPVPRYRRMYKWLSKSFDYIAAVSNYVKTELIEKVGVNPDILRVVPNGVDIDLFHGNNARSRPITNTLNLIAVSRIDANKNLQRLLHGVALARRRGVSINLTHAGTGNADDIKILEEIVRELDLSEVVHFAGYCTNVAPLIEKADCFISASKVECHPVSVLEAMAGGKPCILSKIPPHQELQQSGIILFDDNDESLANALEILAKQRSRFDVLAQSLHKSASKSFSMPVMLARYSALYGSI